MNTKKKYNLIFIVFFLGPFGWAPEIWQMKIRLRKKKIIIALGASLDTTAPSHMVLIECSDCVSH